MNALKLRSLRDPSTTCPVLGAIYKRLYYAHQKDHDDILLEGLLALSEDRARLIGELEELHKTRAIPVIIPGDRAKPWF